MDGWMDGCPFSTAGTSNVRGNSAVNHSWRLRRPWARPTYSSYTASCHVRAVRQHIVFICFPSLFYYQSNQVTLFPQVRCSAVCEEKFGWVTAPLRVDWFIKKLQPGSLFLEERSARCHIQQTSDHKEMQPDRAPFFLSVCGVSVSLTVLFMEPRAL